MIASYRLTLVYSWDSMMHFDKLILLDYAGDIMRALTFSGSTLLHHSNRGGQAPDSNWATNSGKRSDVSGKLIRDYAADFARDHVMQDNQDGFGSAGFDCDSILRKH